MIKLKQINALPQLVDDICRHLDTGICDGKTLIWFGYTMQLNAIQKELIKRGRRLAFAIDNEKSKWGLNPFGLIDCRPPEVLSEYRGTGVVMISSVHREAMTRQVKSCGYSDDQILYFPSPAEFVTEAAEKLLDTASLQKIGHREMQAILTEILKHFRSVCDQHGLRYFLAEGTLLGAVRHKGFIPWDNDIDVFMPYADYQKLIEAYSSGGKYELLCWKTHPSYRQMFCRLADTETATVEEQALRYLLSGISIDIFPIDGFARDAGARAKRIREIYELNILWESMDCFLPEENSSPTQAYEEIERKKFLEPFDSSDYVGMYHFVSQRVPPWTIPRECFAESVDIEFEGEIFKAPIGKDEYLTARYGDYMTLPPEPERFAHGISAYRRVKKEY